MKLKVMIMSILFMGVIGVYGGEDISEAEFITRVMAKVNPEVKREKVIVIVIKEEKEDSWVRDERNRTIRNNVRKGSKTLGQSRSIRLEGHGHLSHDLRSIHKEAFKK